MSANGIVYTKLYQVEFQTIEGEVYPRAPQQKLFTRESIWPEQNGRCHWCGKELTGRKRAYCCDSHRNNYYSFFSWKRIREEVYDLAEGRCLDCNKETAFCKQFGGRLDDLAEIDHIKTIAEGGNFWDLNNLQLFCHKCHVNIKTSRDRQRSSNPRREYVADLMEFFNNAQGADTE